MSLRVLLVTLAAVACLATPAWCGVVAYDASLGALPEVSGWTYMDLAPSAQVPVVSAGVLLSRATTNPDARWWQRSDLAFGFRTGFAMEIVLRAVTSTYNNNIGDGTQRSGYYLDATDSLGRRLSLGIARAGLTLNTDNVLSPTNGIPLIHPVDDAFHLYRVAVIADSAILSVDGARVGATVLGGTGGGDPNLIYFGDGTSAAASEVEIQRVRYGDAAATAAVGAEAVAAPNGLRIAALASPNRHGVDFVVRSGRGGSARLRVLDLAGRRLADLGEVAATAEGARVHWSGDDGSGRAAAAGVYFVTAQGTAGRASCRAIVLR